jgi:hypothetical protein
MMNDDRARLRSLQELEKTIFNAVRYSTGMKDVDLVLKVMVELGPTKFEIEDYTVILKSLVDKGDIVKLEYEMTTRPGGKAIYFSKGTTFNLVKL